MRKKHPGATYYRAWNYTLLGENDQALHWLQKSLEARELEILGLQNDPEIDSLRSDPRYAELVHKSSDGSCTFFQNSTFALVIA